MSKIDKGVVALEAKLKPLMVALIVALMARLGEC
jgi:hypothetical protein